MTPRLSLLTTLIYILTPPGFGWLSKGAHHCHGDNENTAIHDVLSGPSIKARFVACNLRYSVEGQSRRDSPIAFGIDVQVVGSTKIFRVNLGHVSEFCYITPSILAMPRVFNETGLHGKQACAPSFCLKIFMAHTGLLSGQYRFSKVYPAAIAIASTIFRVGDTSHET